MEGLYYEMFFKRKSFHRFTGLNNLTEDVIQEIQSRIQRLQPLVDDIRVEFRIVPREQTTCKRGEYCILIYCEMKEHYLHNVGYMAQQLDLWMVSKNIGACWYGMGKPAEMKYHGLDFIIMITIGKADEKDFRKDYTKAKRKDLSEIWVGNVYHKIASVVRYAPSACNTQPWLVLSEESCLELYRVKGKRGMMPLNRVDYYNQIDMGIFMLFLEICFEHEKVTFTRELHAEVPDEQGKLLTAIYRL